MEPSNENLLKKYGNAKAISSDQFFGVFEEDVIFSSSLLIFFFQCFFHFVVIMVIFYNLFPLSFNIIFQGFFKIQMVI